MFDGPGITPQRKNASSWSKKPFTPRAKGSVIDKNSQEYKTALYAAQKGLPPRSQWTFGEVQIFHNKSPKRCQTEYILKVSATTETDFERLTAATRRHLCVDRWAALSPVNNFVRNFAPSRKRNRDQRLDETLERPLFTALVTVAREYNRNRVEGQPAAVLGCMSVRYYGAGTVRNGGQFALVFWQPDGNNDWLPIVYLTSFHGDATFTLKLPPQDRQEGRHEQASAWLHLHYSDAYRQHLIDLRQKAVERDARKAS